jgi:subtilisin
VVGAFAGSALAMAPAATTGDPIPGQYIVVLKPGADPSTDIALVRSLGGVVSMQYRYALDGFAAGLSPTALTALLGSADVSFVAPDEQGWQEEASCDPTAVQCLPTGVDRIDGERSSTRSGDGKGSVSVNVAVLDSGIDASDPELNVVDGTNCTNDHLGATVDPAWHGTFVSGILAAEDNGSGVVGVAPGAPLDSVRVLNKNGGGTTSSILCGIDWVTGTRSDSNPANDVAIANMSLYAKGSDDGNCGSSNKDPDHFAI